MKNYAEICWSILSYRLLTSGKRVQYYGYVQAKHNDDTARKGFKSWTRFLEYERSHKLYSVQYWTRAVYTHLIGIAPAFYPSVFFRYIKYGELFYENDGV